MHLRHEVAWVKIALLLGVISSAITSSMQIFIAIRLAQDSVHRNHCKDVEHRTIISDHAFWQSLLDIVATRKENNLLDLMLAAFSQEVKTRRGSSEWPGNAFSRLPTTLPSHVGTYHLETSTGYIFTGSSFGGFFSAANEPGSGDHPSKAIVPL